MDASNKSLVALRDSAEWVQDYASVTDNSILQIKMNDLLVAIAELEVQLISETNE